MCDLLLIIIFSVYIVNGSFHIIQEHTSDSATASPLITDYLLSYKVVDLTYTYVVVVVVVMLLASSDNFQ